MNVETHLTIFSSHIEIRIPMTKAEECLLQIFPNKIFLFDPAINLLLDLSYDPSRIVQVLEIDFDEDLYVDFYIAIDDTLHHVSYHQSGEEFSTFTLTRDEYNNLIR